MGKVLSPTWFETRFFKSLWNIQMGTFLFYCRHREEELIVFIDLQLPCLCSGEAQANCTPPCFLFLTLTLETRSQLNWFWWGHPWCRFLGASQMDVCGIRCLLVPDRQSLASYFLMWPGTDTVFLCFRGCIFTNVISQRLNSEFGWVLI